MLEISFLQQQDINQWDDYVANHLGRSPYHLIAWKTAIERSYKHSCFYWLAKDKNNNIVGILPSAWVKTPFSKGSLCALPFCDVGGVLADSKQIDKALIDTAIAFCQQHNITIFDHRSSQPSELSVGEENSIVSDQAPKVRMLMPFPATSEELFSGFKSKLRSQIRKAEKNGLTATIGNDVQHLDAFYQVFSVNMRDLGSPVHSKQWFEQIILAYQGNAIIANVYFENKVIGAGIVLFINGKASIPWASTNATYNKLAPNMLLYWTLLKYANDNGCEEFDFGRSSLGEGTFRFKSQWGAQPTLLNWQQFNNDGQLKPQILNGKSKLRELVEKTWRKFPVKLSEYVGPKIRKYISL